MTQTTPGLFDPDGLTWVRVSPRLIAARLVVAGAWFGAVAVVVAVVALLTGVWWVWLGLVGWAAFAGWVAWAVPRQVRAFGYAERDGDLCVTSGLAWRRLLVVPIGRLQVVKVSAGPVQKAFGLATVELVTVSPQTNAAIPGLPADAAVALRDRLIEASDTTGSGL